MTRGAGYDPAVVDRARLAIRKGLPRRRLGPESGVSSLVMRAWLAAGESDPSGQYGPLARAVALEENDYALRVLDRIQRLSSDAADDRVRLQASAWLLEKGYPADFGRAQTGTQEEPIRVQLSADVQLRPLFSDEQLAVLSSEQIRAAIGAARTPLVLDEAELEDEDDPE